MNKFSPKKLIFAISEAKKQKGEHCCAHSCKNKPNARKRGLCHKHYAILRRISDPVYDRYFNFRGNAKRRGKEFSITLLEFRNFCEETGYIVAKGMRGSRCSIDRIDNAKGYHIDNIQILSMRKNLEKYHNSDKNNNGSTPF